MYSSDVTRGDLLPVVSRISHSSVLCLCKYSAKQTDSNINIKIVEEINHKVDHIEEEWM